MRPIYIVGTHRDVGKTTISLGLLRAFVERGLKVGYTKPLGQRMHATGSRMLHDDVRLAAKCLGIDESQWPDMSVPLPRGRVEKEVHDLHTDELMKRVEDNFRKLAKERDVVVIEAMGHVAMGSCLDMSAADVAKRLGAKTLLISGGGIGRAIDEIALCSTFISTKNADFMGVVVNKVWPDKYDRVKEATTIGLGHMGITTFGTIPYEEKLSAPTMDQIYKLIGGRIICGSDNFHSRVAHTIVAAMEADNMIRYIVEDMLVITPGDRSDNIMAAIGVHMLSDEKTKKTLAGMILTGGFKPEKPVLEFIRNSKLPVFLADEDTYSVASKIKETTFKITPHDDERIQWAVNLVCEYIDVDAIIEQLKT